MKELSIEEKQLLLKDLCARLPYHTIVSTGEEDLELVKVDILNGLVYIFSESFLEFDVFKIKPYLRPMSSMTEEEKKHISKMMCIRTYDNGVVYDMTYPVYTPYYVMEDCLGYLRSIHVDYSGLIEKELALEAPEGMYKEWISIRGNLKEDKEGNIVGGLKL